MVKLCMIFPCGRICFIFQWAYFLRQMIGLHIFFVSRWSCWFSPKRRRKSWRLLPTLMILEHGDGSLVTAAIYSCFLAKHRPRIWLNDEGALLIRGSSFCLRERSPRNWSISMYFILLMMVHGLGRTPVPRVGFPVAGDFHVFGTFWDASQVRSDSILHHCICSELGRYKTLVLGRHRTTLSWLFMSKCGSGRCAFHSIWHATRLDTFYVEGTVQYVLSQSLLGHSEIAFSTMEHNVHTLCQPVEIVWVFFWERRVFLWAELIGQFD